MRRLLIPVIAAGVLAAGLYGVRAQAGDALGQSWPGIVAIFAVIVAAAALLFAFRTAAASRRMRQELDAQAVMVEKAIQSARLRLDGLEASAKARVLFPERPEQAEETSIGVVERVADEIAASAREHEDTLEEIPVSEAGNVVPHPKRNAMARKKDSADVVVADTLEAAFEPAIAVPEATVAAYRVMAAQTGMNGQLRWLDELPTSMAPAEALKAGTRLINAAAMLARQHFRQGGVQFFCPLAAQVFNARNGMSTIAELFEATPELARSIVIVLPDRADLQKIARSKNGIGRLADLGVRFAISVSPGFVPDREDFEAVRPAYVILPFQSAHPETVRKTTETADAIGAVLIATGLENEDAALNAAEAGAKLICGAFLSEPKLLKNLRTAPLPVNSGR